MQSLIHFDRIARLVLAVSVACALGACATRPAAPLDDAYARALPNVPSTLRSSVELTEMEGPRNAVRNLTDLAVSAMRVEQYGVAERSLDAAIARIDSIVPSDANSARAKSHFYAEDVKDFKGEPYERAMVYYYRGLLFARSGDYQNARAAFLAGGWQAAVSPQEKFGKTFGLMSLLGSWASRCEGDTARAQDLQAAAELEDPSLHDVLPVGGALVLFESGAAPRKERAGKRGEVLTFAATERLDATPLASGVAASAARGLWQPKLSKAADLSTQATSRDGRPIQGILNGKAQFKDTSETVGLVATTMGQQMILSNVTGNRDINNLGLLGMVIGLGSSVASLATKPEADTRQIRLLPNEVHVASSGALLAGTVQITLGSTAPIATRLLSANQHCQLHWGSASRGALDAAELRPDRRNADASRQPAFRTELATIVHGG